MRFSAASLLLGLSWITAAAAHNIQLRAHSRECFHETLHKDDRMTVSFQVGDREFGGSGNLEIDFWVCSPSRVKLVDVAKQDGSKSQFLSTHIYPPPSSIWFTEITNLLCFFLRYCRSRTPRTTVNTSDKPSRPKTTRSPRTRTANTTTASATRAGLRTRRKFRSTCTELSTSRNRKWRRIPWRRKVGENTGPNIRVRKDTWLT